MEIVITDHARRRAELRLGCTLDLYEFEPTRRGNGGSRLWTRPDGAGVLVAERPGQFTVVTVLSPDMVKRTPFVRLPGNRPKLPPRPDEPTLDAMIRLRGLSPDARTSLADQVAAHLHATDRGPTTKAVADLADLDSDFALAVLTELEAAGRAVRDGDR